MKPPTVCSYHGLDPSDQLTFSPGCDHEVSLVSDGDFRTFFHPPTLSFDHLDLHHPFLSPRLVSVVLLIFLARRGSTGVGCF